MESTLESKKPIECSVGTLCLRRRMEYVIEKTQQAETMMAPRNEKPRSFTISNPRAKEHTGSCAVYFGQTKQLNMKVTER